MSVITVDNPYGGVVNSTYADLVGAAKEVFGQYTPYTVSVDIAGTVVTKMNEHFLGCVRNAMSDGCVARMGKAELKFWLDFVSYQNDIQDGTRDDVNLATATKLQKELETAYATLSQWIVDELAGNKHVVIDCFTTDYKVV